MKKTYKVLIFAVLAICAVMFTGCKKDPVRVPIEDISTLNADLDWTKAEPHQLHIIRSADELSGYVLEHGNGMPEIDFTQKTLLLAKGERWLTVIFEKELLRHDDGKYTLKLKVSNVDYMATPEWRIMYLIPAIPAGAEVELKLDDPGPMWSEE